jgi:hypothetical protein
LYDRVAQRKEKSLKCQTIKKAKEYLQFIFHKDQYQYSFRDDYPGGFEGWQSEARALLQQLMALEKISQQAGEHEVSIELKKPHDMGEYTRQKGWIETEPGVRITFWLLKPKSAGPHPLGIFPHGHGLRSYDTYAGVFPDEQTRREKLAEDRDVAVQG